MDEELTTEKQQALEELCKSVAHRITQGETKISIAADFVKLGWNQDSAIEFIRDKQQTLEKLYESVSYRITQGETKSSIASDLVKQGWNEESAAEFVNNCCDTLKDFIEDTVEEYEDPIVEDRKRLIKTELETLNEEELKERMKEPLPPWAWVFPIVFGFLGGLGSYIAFNKKRGAGWLMIVGIIVQMIMAAIARRLF
jgi:AAA+ ATPase superfamily predicted ATPase